MEQIRKQLRYAVAGLMPILDDPSVTDLHINGANDDGPTNVFIKRNGIREMMQVNITTSQLRAAAKHAAVLNGNRITDADPFAPGLLPDGQRCHIIAPTANAEGRVAMSIRRTQASSPTPDDLERLGVFEKAVRADQAPPRAGLEELLDHYRHGRARLFIETAFRYGFSGLFCGVVNTGKTYNMRAFFHAIPLHRRIVTVSDTFELPDMPQKDVLHLIYPKTKSALTSHTAEGCVEVGLRTDPDEIINAEVRDGAAWAMVRAGLSGHPFKTSCHALSAKDAMNSMMGMIVQHKDAQKLPAEYIRELLHHLVHFIVFCEVVDDKRRVTQIWCGLEAEGRNEVRDTKGTDNILPDAA